MKKIVLVFLIVFSLSAHTLASPNYSLGIVLGDFTGMSFQVDKISYSRKKSTALDFALNFNTGMEYFCLYVDYLLKDNNVVKKVDFTGELPFLCGIGLKMNSYGKENGYGLRLILGFEYIFKEIPFNVFGTLSPTIDLKPKTSLYLSPSFGVRYCFK